MEVAMTAETKLTRRLLIQSAATFAAGAVLGGIRTSSAAEQAKLSKEAMKYQDKPNGEKECDDCIQFIPGKSADAPGTCKVVQGSINPHGYCIAFVPKPKG
jgi:hypothetical protein